MTAITTFFSDKGLAIKYLCIASNKETAVLKRRTMIQILLNKALVIDGWFLDGVLGKCFCLKSNLKHENKLLI